jgi:hypothetical protein
VNFPATFSIPFSFPEPPNRTSDNSTVASIPTSLGVRIARCQVNSFVGYKFNAPTNSFVLHRKVSSLRSEGSLFALHFHSRAQPIRSAQPSSGFPLTNVTTARAMPDVRLRRCAAWPGRCPLMFGHHPRRPSHYSRARRTPHHVRESHGNPTSHEVQESLRARVRHPATSSLRSSTKRALRAQPRSQPRRHRADTCATARLPRLAVQPPLRQVTRFGQALDAR